MACLALVALGAWGPSVEQSSHHYAFADQRHLFGIPNMMDVLSNLAFAGFGVLGGWRMSRLPQGITSNTSWPASQRCRSWLAWPAPTAP